ncbi:MAG TPA: HAF repeat-containing protein [Candidatus Binatia bacterium]|nr:HAF repeat-containing protein [Candidatus Binatia bacterium]
MRFVAGFSKIAGLALMAASASLISAQTYTITDLGPPSGDDYSVAHAINASGQIAGGIGNDRNNIGDVGLYSAGQWTSLGTLGGDSGIGNGINSLGQIAGYSTDANGTYHAFISENGKLVDIGDLGGGSATAYAINDSGQVVGSAVTSKGSNHPFLYSNGTMIDLGTLGSPQGNMWWNSAEAVNEAGVVAGVSYTPRNGFRGFVWKNGVMTPVGNLGGFMSEAYGINNKNQTTGIAYLADGEAHAYIGTGSKMQDLGALETPLNTSWGFGINDAGVVVGFCNMAQGEHAFVYSNGTMKDLNKLIPSGSGWVLYQAFAINNAGQIVGSGELNGEGRGFLLTPQ